ncbi:MAG: glucosaminidase domain-containing protein, partial [Erysipelotrichaceae bacterium]|nr:glucosaminidase domain-containing protein [Erysipelotrichaceae bacterium]
MSFSMFFVVSSSEVEAKEYAFGCDAYELAWVNDAGDFETVACYGSFAEAKAAMTQDDYVVRHPSSKSPTKIIAIKSGIAISYPRRNGSTTLNVYQHQDYVTDKGKYKDTYVTQHRELFQPETVSYNGNGEGNVKLVLHGFEGYAKLSGMDLVPMKFIEKGLVITLGGQTNDNGVPENPFEMIPKLSHYSVIQNGNYKDLVYTYYSGYDGKAYSLTIGPAADWMSVGQTYYSKDGYNFYADAKMSNYLATYYSYYVFLPFRSRSNIQGSTFDAYLAAKGFTEKPTSTSTNDLTERQSQLAGEGQMFVDSQNVYGVNALLTYAMACNESGYGRSTYAVSKNNLFGWAAVDSNPDNATQFGSIATGIQEQMAYNLRGYLDIFDVRFFGMHLGNKESGFNVKYASDPYWGYKIAAIAYDIDKFSKNYDGTLSDSNTYSLGLINTFQTPYYRTASTSSEVMFTSEYSSQYQKNHIVIVNGESNGFYQVQSPNAILPDGTVLKNKVSGVQQPASSYDFARSIGFIASDKVTLLNEFNHVTIPGQTPEGEFVFNLSDFSVNDKGILSIAGAAYRPGIYITQTNQLVHTLKVFDEFYDQKLEARMVTALKENTQDQAEFNGTLDLDGLEDGKYYFRFNSDYSSFEEYCDTRVISTSTQ